jgi:hypothetical protein
MMLLGASFRVGVLAPDRRAQSLAHNGPAHSTP